MREEELLWRPHVGGFAWPTVLLAAAVFVLTATTWAGALAGWLPLWAGFLLETLAAYLAFTVMHEAAHGNVHGRHRRLKRLGEGLGWLVSVTLIAPYPAFRVLHLRHHAHTNDPDKDPDFFVAGPPLLALARCFVTIPSYYAEFLVGKTSKTSAGRRERRAVWVAVALYGVLGAALVGLGLWREALALWVSPAIVAAAVLAFVFDWLPHHPHDSRERYRDTRSIDLRPLDVLCAGQNLHTVHHLFPRVPFYRYRAVFEAGRERLRERGTPIVPDH